MKPIRYSNCRIDFIPSEMFPEMVVISKTPKILKQLKEKRYVTLDKAKIAIDYHLTTQRIESTNIKSSSGELAAVVVIDD